jgi:poly(3-hydroxybutyrate) depolymerase
MVAHMVKTHGLDPKRIFVTGLSAGGAMTSVMLAAYPDVFAGGAVIAGLPFATANSVPEALDRMRGHGGPANDRLSSLVTGASGHRGPWPTLSVWHGTSDSTVDPVNADAIVDQWRSLHKVEGQSERSVVDGYPREIWRDSSGRAVIEKYDIKGMGHGTPLDPGGDGDCGKAGPFMLDAQICSTSHIARFWGLTDETVRTAKEATGTKARPAEVRGGVGSVIEDALRAAGLMR